MLVQMVSVVYLFTYFNAESPRADVKYSVITSVARFVAMSVISINLRTLSTAKDS
jgi:hypothetical protein